MTTETISKRGRPKGTGLDDRDLLKAIAALMTESMGLKPTTAIKSLGITNPSTVRRLRDKFNLQKDILLSEAKNVDSKKQDGQTQNCKVSEDEESEFEQPIKVPQSISDNTTAVSAITCALNKKKDHMITEEKSSKKKRKSKSKKSRAKKAEQISLKNKSDKTKENSAPAIPATKQTPTLERAPAQAMSLFNA